MYGVRDILLGLLLPFGVACVVALLDRRRAAGWTAPIAIGAAFFAGYYARYRPARLPPHDAIDWLSFAAPVLALVGIVDWWLSRKGGAVRALARVGLVFFAMMVLVWLLARPRIEHAWSAGEAMLWIIGISVVATLLWIILEPLPRRSPGATLPIALLIVAAHAAAVSLMTGSQKLSLIGAILTASVAGIAGVALLRRGGPALGGGGTLVFVLLYTGFLACASVYFYSEMTPVESGLLLIAPVMAWAGEIPPIARRGNLARGAARVIAVLLPAGTALVVAWVEFARAMRASHEVGW